MAHRKTTIIQKLGYVLETVCVVPIGTLISLMPLKLSRMFSKPAGMLAFYLDRRDRRLAYQNLDVVFPDPPLSKSEKDRIIKRLFINIAEGVFQFFNIGGLTPVNFERNMDVGNYRVIDRALEEKKGVLAFTAHLGNWEYFGRGAVKLGYDVATVIKRQHNPYTDRWFKKRREVKGGVKCVYIENAVMAKIGSHLKRNGILAILADQAYIDKPVYAPFFGVSVATADGPAKLHLWFGTPIVMAFCIRQPGGRYRLMFDGPYHFERTGNMRADCEKLMTWVNGKYEDMIRRYPDQWFSLLTPRWAHRPPA
ncbi:MAG: hypothetical protein JRF65_10590 [Deltaproteobacteria bacterium]|nr:hypothetical protein [Deltaproteobacteria bacterium]MBW2285033.1 hypothetical protein [Deltaproteobacteria bacterium]